MVLSFISDKLEGQYDTCVLHTKFNIKHDLWLTVLPFPVSSMFCGIITTAVNLDVCYIPFHLGLPHRFLFYCPRARSLRSDYVKIQSKSPTDFRLKI